ncbi:hypothetical protein NFI96_004951 [Prochilodus magdalenae]|nr:hypothetical protein NFI96_004951 [Prochilodus magdalenae]
MVVDIHRARPITQPVSTEGVEVERVKTYRYLGLHLGDRLDWSANTDILYRKGQSRLYCLRRLGSFNICRKLLQLFYQTVVSSCLLYAVVCWGGSIKKRDYMQLDKLVRPEVTQTYSWITITVSNQNPERDELDRYTEYRVKIIREHLEILLEDRIPVGVQPLGGNDTTMMMGPDEEQTEPIREPVDMELDKAEGGNLEMSLGDLVSNTEDQTKVSDLLLEIPLEEVPSQSVLPLAEMDVQKKDQPEEEPGKKRKGAEGGKSSIRKRKVHQGTYKMETSTPTQHLHTERT